MEMKRRDCLKATVVMGALSLGQGCTSINTSCRDIKGDGGVSVEALDQAANKKVLHLEDIHSPIVIDSIQLLKQGNQYLVHVRSKEGAEGISFHNGRGAYLYPLLNQRVIPFFLRRDARGLEDDLWELYRYKSNYKLQGLAFWSVTAWVEFAILDMIGRAYNKSYSELLGGRIRDRVPFYVASSRRDSTPQEEVEYLRRLLEETGAKAIKFRVGGRMSRNADAIPGRTEQLIPLVRETFGDTIDIHADSNSSYNPPEAIKVGRILEDAQAVYFEEPCPFDHLEDTKRVADALTIPVAGGEQEFSERRFRWMVYNRGVDIVQPDLHYYGGLIRSRRVAQMADVAGMPTTVHISGGFGFIYMLHFAAVTPKIGAYQEYKRGIERYSDWFESPLKIVDGALTVPRGPGVGIKDIRPILKGATPVV